MFSSSSQAKHWVFTNEQKIFQLHHEANQRYVESHQQDAGGSSDGSVFFLTPAEEKLIYSYYEFTLKEFCKKFQPPIPRSVVGTSFHYFKRFYLNNSVMDYHPKHMLVTCIYLACKVEEFNVSITQFVANVKGDREKATDIILNNELLLMQHLHYHLTVHNAYRPVEGILIDMKTRCPQIPDPENLRPLIDDFLERSLFTNAMLLFSPSQIALTGVFYAANKAQINFDSYLSEVLFSGGREKVAHTKEIMKNIISMVKAIEFPSKELVKAAEKKLEKCRNQENNPDSAVYKRKLQEMLNEESLERSRKYARVSEEQRKAEDDVVAKTKK